MIPFDPFFRNSHLATIAANFWPRDFSHYLIAEQVRYFATEVDVQVKGIVQNPLIDTPLCDVILLHGLEGSHQSGYMVSMSHALASAGFRTTRLNMRTCGGTEHLCKTLYHAGLTSDLRSVVRQYIKEGSQRIYLIGFSLGGNVVLKYSGEASEQLPAEVAGTVAVSTPVNLETACLHMMKLKNRVYEKRFVARLKNRYRRRCIDHPEIYQLAGLEKVRSVYGFDDVITAPYFKFGTAADYYRTQSSVNFIGNISIPTLMIQAEDDPLVPFEVYRHEAIHDNPNVKMLTTKHGGHVGFVSRRQPRFWLDEVVKNWITTHL